VRPFAVIVPVYNEEAGMGATLDALLAQDDRDFSLVLVDNRSTDGSRAIAEAFARAHPALDVHVIEEERKGSGAAGDAGMRYAIAHGARYLARTDADCLPLPGWVARLRRALADDGLEFVAGKIRPRTDDIPLRARDRVLIPLCVALAENYGRVVRRGPQFRYRYMMAAANNLAITADMYVRAGGFPRTSIAEEVEGRALSERVRTLTDRAAFLPDAVVLNSVRRLRAYGYLNTLRFYRNHAYRPALVDVR
jgi:glycosyltransferase involved in cell wall biosynthesis